MNMPIAAANALAELDEVPEGFELIDGELVEKSMSAESDWVGGELAARMRVHCWPQNLGWVFQSETGYRCFANRKMVRKPDVSFVRAGRFTNNVIPKGDVLLVPDMATEVISPNDLVVDHDRKIEEYLAAGVKLVWSVNPNTRVVIVHRADGTMTKLRENDVLSGEDVIPGFACRVGDFLPPVPPVPAANP